MAEIVFVYMTAADEGEAMAIARTIVTEQLAACANILPGMRSVYRWEGNVEEGREVVLIAKTQAHQFQALAARVRELHSYATPCIVELPIGRGDAPYLDWLVRESSPDEG